jgi:hypothetical protein
MRAACAPPFPWLFAAVLARPNPCGARPRSVTPPCAAHVRVPFVVAEGGRFDESSRCRGDIGEGTVVVDARLFIAGAFGAVVRGFIAPLLAGRFSCVPVPFMVLPLTGPWPGRPAVNPVVLIAWTGMREAACPGVVRAITARFCTALGGVATCPPVLAVPR